MNPAALVGILLVATALKTKLVMTGRLAQTAIIAPFVFAPAIPNAYDISQAAIAWTRISGEISKLTEQINIATGTLLARWDSDDGRAFLLKLSDLKTEIGQVNTAATGATTTIGTLGAFYLALFTKLAAFVTAMITYLMSMAALQATPAGPAAKAAAEAGGITTVVATAATVKLLVAGAAPLAIALAQSGTALVAFNVMQNDTGKIGTPDIKEISIDWDGTKADPVPTKP